jgi:hypothetical protein
MFIEPAIIIKDDERTYTRKIEPYVSSKIDQEDVIHFVKTALKEFSFEPDDVKVRIIIQL